MQDKKTERKYAKADKKIAKATGKGPVQEAKAHKKYGYNYDSAIKSGIGPDATGHWPSRNPDTGEILKGRRHPTINKTRQGEKKAGYKIYRKGDTLYSKPKNK